MTGPYREMEVRLQRDAFGTPWGFRLQGGKDFNAPLAVQRVFVGSPAQLDLQRGDVILNIQNYDVTTMTHKQAQEVIRNAGGSLAMTIKRGPRPTNLRPISPKPDPAAAQQFFRSRSFEAGLSGGSPGGGPSGALGFIPKPQAPQMSAPTRTPSFGIDYTRSGAAGRPQHFNRPQELNRPQYGGPQSGPTYPSSMLNKLNKSLTDRLWTPGDPQQNGDDYYDGSRRPVNQQAYSQDEYDLSEPRKSVKELKSKYNKPWKQNESLTNPQDTATPEAAQTGSGPDQDAGDMSYYQMGDYTMPAAQRSPRQQRRVWSRPDDGGQAVSSGLREPGWDPRLAQQRAPQRVRQWAPVQPPVNHPVPVNARRMQPAPPSGVPRLHSEPPAWKGTLKSSGAPRLWEGRAPGMPMPQAQGLPSLQAPEGRPYSPTGADGRPASPHPPATVQPHKPRLQKMSYGPDGGQCYSQESQPGPDTADGAKVVHLQYNSPLQLYSRNNVEDSLKGQTQGMPGEGSMHITGGGTVNPDGSVSKAGDKDFSRSELAQMVHMEDARAAGRLRPASPFRESARNVEMAPGNEMNYIGYQDQGRQSPTFHQLEYQVAQEAEKYGDHGTSDF